MDIADLIMRTIKKRGKVKSREITRRTRFSRAYVNRFFQKLRDEGRIIQIGKANQAHYVLATESAVDRIRRNVKDIHRVMRNEGIHEDEVLDKIKNTTGIFHNVPDNISRIVEYAFTEMLNNAIEHSCSKSVEITMNGDADQIRFSVTDRGVGIFNNIMKKKGLADEMEAIQDLLKGKLSTDPASHSGEGIFFTSRVADMFHIQSSRKKVIFNNLINDIFIRDIKNHSGTKVVFSIGLDSRRDINGVFRQYTDDRFSFSKTVVTIKLYKMRGGYISRSQARRMLTGLSGFKTVIMDFKNIDTVGQAFADEVFRVWKSTRPDIEIMVRNANENVRFMIERSKANKD